MKTINLCGNPKCCPSVKEDTKKDVIHIVDGKQKITLNREHQQKLAKYLCSKHGCCKR